MRNLLRRDGRSEPALQLRFRELALAFEPLAFARLLDALLFRELAVLLRLRVGSFLRFTDASSSNCPSLMDFTMLLDAPRSEDFDFSPRFAASAAPAAICCFFDLAGIPQLRVASLLRSRLRYFGMMSCMPGLILAVPSRE